MSAKIGRLEMAELASALQQALAARVNRLGYLGEFFKCAGQQPDVLSLFLEDTSILCARAPEGNAVVGVLRQDKRDGRPPGAVAQNGDCIHRIEVESLIRDEVPTTVNAN